MRIRHAAQCASGWPANTVNDCRDRAKFTDAVEHIRWRLWHGQTGRALCLIQRTLADVNAKAEGKTAPARSAAKLAKALIALETYVSGLADLIIDYASARLDDEPFSTSPTEGAVQWLLHRRMGARQQMRWSPLPSHRRMIAPTFGTVSRTATHSSCRDPLGSPCPKASATAPPRWRFRRSSISILRPSPPFARRAVTVATKQL